MISTSLISRGPVRILAASSEKGCVDRPWKLRDQSTCVVSSSRKTGASFKPETSSSTAGVSKAVWLRKCEIEKGRQIRGRGL